VSHPVVPPPHDGGHPPAPGRGPYGPEQGWAGAEQGWTGGEQGRTGGEQGWAGDVSDWPTRVDGPPVAARPAEDAGWWDEVSARPDATGHWAPPAPARPDHDEPWPDPRAAWSEPAAHPGPAGHPEPGEPAVAPPARRRSSAGRLVLHIGLAVFVGLGVFALKSVLFGDQTRHAQAGDCVATGDAAPARQRTEAKIVDCGSADARFTVAGRVDGTTGTDGPVCDRFFQPEEQFWVYSSEASGGYVLCLRPNG
jgi:hypothetical protein